MPCFPGTVLGGTYRILEELGRGGNGTVYLARHERAGRLWAVKEIPKKGNSLIMEARLLKKLHHPGLPSMGDILEENEMIYLVMDYIEGCSLKEILEKEKSQSQEKVVEWGIQLCGVLAYLHSQSVIYRDMKPSNIMLGKDGRIVLVDFGTARERKAESEGDTECLGTRGYAAPEQYGGRGQTGPETDIYGLGAVMYHLLTGKNPLDPPYGYPPIRRIRPDLSGGLEKILAICTRENPEERYHTCMELLQALEHYEELEEAYVQKKKRKKLFLKIIVSAVMIIFAGCMSVWMKQKSEIKKNYEIYLTEAAGSVDRDKKEELLRQAIIIDSREKKAYEQLLQCFLEDDGSFSAEEERFWKETLNERNTKGKRCVEELQENRGAYVSVAYHAGLMYFYYYEESGGKRASFRWFQAAAEGKRGKELLESEYIRAEILKRISGYYDLLDKQGRTGDIVVSYKEYWNDLTALIDRGIEKEDNWVTAFVIYREMALQVTFHAEDFSLAGVSKQQVCGQLDTIKKNIKEWEESTEEKTEYERSLFHEVEEGIEAAEASVMTVYQEENRWEKEELS